MSPYYSEARRFRGLPIQLKYAVILTVVAGFTSLLMIFVMAWFIQRNYNLFLADELGLSAQVIEIVRHEQHILELSLFVLFLVSITVTFLAALYVTRRLTGPMVAVQRQLWLYSQGDWTHPFRLRQNDEFHELENIMNQLRQNCIRETSSRSKESTG